ncbi:hypothetical protein [Saccharibacillus kuerlensis]|uniref:Lipoprotein n=1 Tax=Saccharibacillus kuerlensis TaxID=459527 RepID=A0ABQ2KZ65_9BACL|nr:hypothetical protein [Saccharibacillus kuerlensis]GGN97639.1 hypothetical protein GCM10010969_15670 [Saccharibacillus kuerlensis]
MKRSHERKGFAWPMVLILLVCLTSVAGCSSWLSPTTTEWTNFVKLDDTMYMALEDDSVLRDPDMLTNHSVGTVKQKLNNNVEDFDYNTKSGDAGYLEKGTELYRVEGFQPSDVVAVRTDRRIDGIQLYVRQGFDDIPTNDFERILRADPSSVQIHSWSAPQQKEVKGSEAEELIGLLQNSVYEPIDGVSYSEETRYYEIAFDTGEPILYTFPLVDEGPGENENIRFRNDYVVDDSIQKFLTP